MTALDPADYIITRKRKKYRFALFANSPLCFEYEEWDKETSAEVVEVGAGTGLFSVELATLSPDKQFVAVDIKADRLQKGAREAEARGLKNIRFLRVRADQLGELFAAGSLQSLWLTFPDPFPKIRSAKHRLTHPIFLKRYAGLLRPGGSLRLKHDNREFFCWSLEQLVAQRWQLQELSFDLHESDLADSYKIMTTYERRWTSEGRPTHFVKASPSI